MGHILPSLWAAHTHGTKSRRAVMGRRANPVSAVDSQSSAKRLEHTVHPVTARCSPFPPRTDAPNKRGSEAGSGVSNLTAPQRGLAFHADSRAKPDVQTEPGKNHCTKAPWTSRCIPKFKYYCAIEKNVDRLPSCFLGVWNPLKTCTLLT